MSALTTAVMTTAAPGEDGAGGREVLRGNGSAVVEVWGWTCPRCVIDSTPLPSPGEAGHLAGVHDRHAHGGAPTAWVWAGPLDQPDQLDDQLDDQDDDQDDDVTSDGDGGRR